MDWRGQKKELEITSNYKLNVIKKTWSITCVESLPQRIWPLQSMVLPLKVCKLWCVSRLRYPSLEPVQPRLNGSNDLNKSQMSSQALLRNHIRCTTCWEISFYSFSPLGPVTATDNGAIPALLQSTVKVWGILARTLEPTPGPESFTLLESTKSFTGTLNGLPVKGTKMTCAKY